MLVPSRLRSTPSARTWLTKALCSGCSAALGWLHLAGCTWLAALGWLHLAGCTWLAALGWLHLAGCTSQPASPGPKDPPSPCAGIQAGSCLAFFQGLRTPVETPRTRCFDDYTAGGYHQRDAPRPPRRFMPVWITAFSQHAPSRLHGSRQKALTQLTHHRPSLCFASTTVS